MNDLHRIFAALSNSDRLAILRALLLREDARTEVSASISDLARDAGVSRFSASRHLSILRSAGLVKAEPLGLARVHQLDVRALQLIEDWLYTFLDVTRSSD